MILNAEDYSHKTIKEIALLIFKDGEETLILQPVLESSFETNLYFFSLSAVPRFYGSENPLIMNTLHDITSAKIFCNFSSLFKMEETFHLTPKTYPYTETQPYNFYVLFPFNEDEFNLWISDYKLPDISQNEMEHIAGYFSSDEPIMAISFSKKIGTASAITPIKVVFNSKALVYTLPLLFSQNSVKLDLYVVAESSVHIEGFSTLFCDTFRKIEKKELSGRNSRGDKSAFKGKHSGIIITENSVSNYLWDNCVLSLLSGETPSLTKNNNKLLIHYIPFKTVQQFFFSHRFAVAFAISIFCLVLLICIMTVLIMLSTTRYVRYDLFFLYACIILTISLLMAFLIYDSLPQITLFV
jgi:hypothetical protein